MTYHRKLTVQMWVIAAAALVLAAFAGHGFVWFVAGAAFGSAYLMTMICWKWGI